MIMNSTGRPPAFGWWRSRSPAPEDVDDGRPERHLVLAEPYQPLAELGHEPPPLGPGHVLEERQLIELGHELDVARDREPVDELAALGADVAESGGPQLAGRPRDRRDVPVPAVVRGVLEAELVEQVIEDPIRAPDPPVRQPRDMGEGPARTQHAADLAQDLGPARDELEDERRHREVEPRVLERQ